MTIRLFWTATLTAGAVASQATIIPLDLFQSEDTLTATALGATSRSMAEISAQGAFRHTQISILQNAFAGRAEMRSGKNRGVVSFDAGIIGDIQFVYRDFSIAQRDFREAKTFRVGFLANDQPLKVSLTLQDGAGSVASMMASAGAKAASTETTFTSFDFAGSSVNFQDIRLINVSFENTDPGAMDFVLSRIDAVPEPGTLLAMGAGLSALVARRRRRN